MTKGMAKYARKGLQVIAYQHSNFAYNPSEKNT